MNSNSKHLILHIDDDEANRYAVRRILEKSGFDVVEAESGLQGLELSTTAPIDLIVLDIKLPDISGFEVCKRIKANPQTHSIPVLQTSASFVKSEHKVTGLESGADGYLAQPIEAAVLVATVKSLLRIRSAEKRAQKATRSREQTLAIVSHDLRNPLSFILLQTKLLERQIKAKTISDDQVIDKIQKINGSCHRMNRLIQDLLDVTSIEEGKLSVVMNPVDLNTVVEEAFGQFEEMASLSQLHLRKNLNPAPALIQGDKERLGQLLTNLIVNSLKFTTAGGSIDLTVREHAKDFILEVQDSGTGIAKEDLLHVADRYWQGNRVKKGGFGLGLSIVKGIVAAHHGQFHIDSILGTGTTIQITLPKS